jgi:hypothetical protein
VRRKVGEHDVNIYVEYFYGRPGGIGAIAHYLYEVDGQRTMMKAYIRYLDQFARQPDGSWLFAERKLMVDWTETGPSNP